MNKKSTIFLIIIVIAVVGIFLFAHFYSISLKKYPEEEVIEVKVQPRGELEFIPNVMVFHFSKSFPGVEGITIDESKLPEFITFSPRLTAHGRWISERTFELLFDKPPRPETEYIVTLSHIPLTVPVESIPVQKFSFTTPHFMVRDVSLLSLRPGRAKFAIKFNFPPVLSEIKKYLEILDPHRRKIEILKYEQKTDVPEVIYVTTPVKEAPTKYHFKIKRGLPSTYDVSLYKDFKFTTAIGFTTKPLTVASHKIEESEDGYMIMITLSAPKEKRLVIKEENLKNLIEIEPEISFRVSTSKRFIFIFGDFFPGKEYNITLAAGITSKKGSTLAEDYTFKVTIPLQKEKLHFVYQGRYFGRKGDWKLPLKISRICSLWVDISYMPQTNVLFWHLNNWGRKSYFHRLGDKLVSHHNIPLERPEESQILWLDLKNFLTRPRQGAYLIQTSGKTKKKRYLNARMVVVISDISLVVKWNKNSAYVWAFNSLTLEPENNVAIEIRNSKNFLYGKGSTDPNGFCKVDVSKPGREPYIVFARKGDDWTYAHLPTLRLSKQAYDISGENPSIPYLAYIYPERNLYRPGEKVKFAVVVREPHTFQGVSIPVRIRITDPRGRNYLKLSGKTDPAGLSEFSFSTSASSATGKYKIELFAGERILYTSYVFVETFVPERMRLELSIPDEIDITQPFSLKLNAEYLFGAPAAGEKYTVSASARETDFRCSGYYQYSFGTLSTRSRRSPVWNSSQRRGTLDSSGKARVTFRVDSEFVFQKPVLLTIYATVSEGGSGRVTSRTAEKVIYTRPFYIGIKADRRRVVSGTPVKISGVLLKPNCDYYRKKTKIYYKIYRLTWSYSYRYYEDYYWDAHRLRIPVTEKRPVEVKNGKFSFTFIPQTSYNDYLIEVFDQTTGTTSQFKIAGWGWWYREEEQIESPEVISLRLDKKEYDENEPVTVQARLPFAGKILWTVELDSIYYTALKDAKGEVATWSFRTPKGVSTVYVNGLLIRSGGNYLVQRGFGITRVRIRPKRLKLSLKLNTPDNIHPGEKLTIRIKGNQKFKGTIAVVDEGILQITDFSSPDPYEEILRNMRLAINSAESFGWIVRRFLEKSGGGFVEREKEFPTARFARIVAYWSGILESDEQGNLQYTVSVPQYHGKLRVMVCAMNKNLLGAVQKYVVVKSDVIVSPTIPRFMYTDDEFSFPITLINTTGKKKNTTISIKLTGGRLRRGTNRRTLTISPGEKKILWFDCRAGDTPGALQLKIDGRTGKERYHEEFTLPLYPNVPYLTESEYLTIKPNEEKDLKPYFNNWYPRAHKALLLLSDIPGLTRLNHIRYAIHYPYGCIEQTSTSTLVLLKFAPLLSIIAPDISHEKYIEMVNHGIDRIITMQTISGGFSFWPGGGRTADWSSSYATFVLLEAEDAGFIVPKGVLNAALNYLETRRKKDGFTYYVLARGGRLQKKPEMIDRLVALAQRAKYEKINGLWIAGALYESGKTVQAKDLFEKSFKMVAPKLRRYYHNFYSPLKIKGIELFLIQQINPGTAEEHNLALEIVKTLSRRKSYYYTTQELAWTMLALGHYAETASTGEWNGRLEINGRVVKGKMKKRVLSWVLKNASRYNTIHLKNNSSKPLFLNIENSGFNKNERSFKPYKNGLSLGRKIYDYKGNLINKICSGELAVMKLTIYPSGYYRNVAVELPIPAGLEIENPRLRQENLPTWIDKRHKLWRPDYVDIRDDRLIVFGSTSYDTLYYYTLTRAVTPGKFFLPPTRGMVMYNPDINCHTEAGEFEVLKK